MTRNRSDAPVVAGADLAAPSPRSLWSLALIGAFALFTIAVLSALGVWQLYRLQWKLDLIARVNERVHAAPLAAPGLGSWSGITAEADEYRHLRLDGRFDNGRETFVQAVTALGPGFWVLTPFELHSGGTVLVNRGFVPPERRDRETRRDSEVTGATTVTGLLRMTEPGGGFLRHNDPTNGRWYSRDVGAIAAEIGLDDVVPYFVDADFDPKVGKYPVGGLTVISFPNNHLVYALTWFGLAAMLAGAVVWLARDELRLRHITSSADRVSGHRTGPGGTPVNLS
ncbi:SURF1 family protein [Lichenihabitans psoromatis]|uniref:SURF1 family protein n=1 Tax=Lichenihabitans psoromatis TaxID=2528642 RepID=UPI001FE226DA|nr:SURF1 family protein [Lichenihabitans psoromatis]